MKGKNLNEVIDSLITEHSNISLELKKFLRMAGESDPRTVAGDAIRYYDSVIRKHSSEEEESLVAISRREGAPLDAEGIRLSHIVLEDAREDLLHVLGDRRVSADDIREELNSFLQMNLDHFYAEENQFFVKDLEDIYKRAGSY